MKNKLHYYFLIFTISGFSGLIYQSIWSRYLKMFLGHAAYAQMMVLIIFMGGMAIGSALAARYSHKAKNLIVWYAIAELIVGIFGVLFHGIFTTAIELVFTTLIPSIGVGESGLINATKFSIASAIILPQSILLGATFPLIATGIIRKNPDSSGSTIAKLYFFNSIGAAIGVLSNAFILVPAVGLPGSVLTAGIINILLAITVYRIAKNESIEEAKPTVKGKLDFDFETNIFLSVALFTGLASFMYEIAWIRMLSMVLGASTDAFEIMLSAFIFGLALGSWLIRKKINALKNIITTLAIIQIAMAILAALTIPLYNYTFEIMQATRLTLAPSDIGYNAYRTVSFVICIIVMLPTTICAGTTLPLITNSLLKSGKSESTIGWVYSFNTIGAILGVVLAVQVIMPNLGLEALILTGATLDLLMGIVLLFGVSYYAFFKSAAISSAAIISLTIIGLVSSLDVQKMASGVFRHDLANMDRSKNIYSEHGKTASIAVKELPNGLRVISTNGKPDAGLFTNYTTDNGAYAADEPTMMLAGAIPFLHNPNAVKIANIGFGSGLTSEMVLTNPKVESLDTIEIEEKIIEGAKLFTPKVSRPFNDPRSNIVIDDAKTFFTSNGLQYDIIIAEPSNPWVSGVSSLFSLEYYDLISKHLNQGGVYTQWVQAYEITPVLVASIYKALRTRFKYVSLYSMANSDMAFIASNSLTKPNYNYFDGKEDAQKNLRYINSSKPSELRSKFVANQRLLDPLFYSFDIAPNSDFFPILESEAPKARFKQQEAANAILGLRTAKVASKTTGHDYIFSESNAQLNTDTNTSFSNYDLRYETLEDVFELLRNQQHGDYDHHIVNDNLFIKNRLIFCRETNINNNDVTTDLINYYKHNFELLSDKNALYFLHLIKESCLNEKTSNGSALEITIHIHYLNNDYSSVIDASKEYFSNADDNNTYKSPLIKKLVLSSLLLTKAQSQRAEYEFIEDLKPNLQTVQDPEYIILSELLFAKSDKIATKN